MMDSDRWRGSPGEGASDLAHHDAAQGSPVLPLRIRAPATSASVVDNTVSPTFRVVYFLDAARECVTSRSLCTRSCLPARDQIAPYGFESSDDHGLSKS
jgi:hypothetical protein